ncbi:MAG TPA: MBL fold metallo-hydrolase [Actinocrinis sp.]|nr:MBL fold metallo-hydrolase [Actinocrinis sp.]
MTGDRTMGRAGRSKVGGDSSTKLGRQGGAPRRRKALGVGLAVLACSAVGAALLVHRSAAPDRPPAGWALAVCDVGQGDGMLLAAGPHAAIVVDTGPEPAAEDRCLKRFQITTVPLLVLTHFHADHIGGLSAVLADTRVQEIETTTVDIPPAGAADVRRQASAAGVPVHRVTAHERRSFGAVSWQVLWPDPAFPLGPDGSAPEDHMPGMDMGGGSGDGESPGPNNTSIVMAVTIRAPGPPTDPGPPPTGTATPGPTALHLLLTGDIEQPVQADLLAVDRALLRADVLKVPHHGSANQDPDFVRAVDPTASIISVGAGNPYGHPVARTLRLMGSTGARLYRTDLDGTVTVALPAPGAAGYLVGAEHGDGRPPGSGPGPGASDQATPSRRSAHHRAKGHSRQYSR